MASPWPLVGHSPHHIWNTQYFVHSMQLEKGECISSYDVKATIISVQVDPAISIIKHKMQKNFQLDTRIPMIIQHITTLLPEEYRFPLATCSWSRSLSPRSSELPPIHPGFGLGMWVETLSSKRQNTVLTTH